MLSSQTVEVLVRNSICTFCCLPTFLLSFPVTARTNDDQNERFFTFFYTIHSFLLARSFAPVNHCKINQCSKWKNEYFWQTVSEYFGYFEQMAPHLFTGHWRWRRQWETLHCQNAPSVTNEKVTVSRTVATVISQ